MKRNIYKQVGLLVLFLIPIHFYGHTVEEVEQLFYYAFDKKVPIDEVPGKFMVKKNPDVSKEEIEAIVSSYIVKATFEWFNTEICTVSTDDEIVDQTINHLLTEDAIASARRIYWLTEDIDYYQIHKIDKQPLTIGLIDQVLLKRNDGVDKSIVKGLTDKLGLIEYSSNVLYDIYTVPKDKDILDVVNKIFESGLFEFAYPNLISKVTFCDDMSVYPNDPYFQYQVTLHNTGQSFNGHTGTPDADIDAPEAWALTMGSPEIVIAVIDEGVTSDHPDLPNTRQLRLNGSNFGLGDPNDPSPVGNSNHGNACAGVIAATANNGEGIAGIAPLCKIMPIRTDSTTSPEQDAAAIRFAVDNGASIISCSWGYSCTNNNLHPVIVNAITYAINHNCLVVFSTGNNAKHALGIDGFVGFPANHKINGMLAVGASDRYDKQADYSPTDTCVDIVAPSNRSSYYYYRPDSLDSEKSDMWTIDIPGNDGYNSWHTDQGNEFSFGETLPNSGTNYLSYTGHFGGTSHSCPVVAGVAALVLSVNPQLTPQAVCKVLKESADTVGGFLYGVNGRCNEMGYGRINANNAVWMACDTTFYINERIFNDDKYVMGCDVYMKDDTIIGESSLQVRARNNATIEKNFIIGEGVILDIKPYRQNNTE